MTRTVSIAGAGVAPGGGRDERTRARASRAGTDAARAGARRGEIVAVGEEQGRDGGREDREQDRGGAPAHGGGGGVGGPGSASRGRASGRRLREEAGDGARHGVGDRLLKLGVLQLLLLVGVRDERDLDEDRRHRRADEDAERRLLDAAVGRVRDGVQLDLDRLGDLARLLQVGALGEVPEDEVEVGVAGGRPRARRRRAALAAFSRLATSCAILSDASSER